MRRIVAALAVCVLTAATATAASAGQGPVADTAASRDRKMLHDVLSWLDLDRPGLAAVKNASTDEQAAAALLDYYRAASAFRHPGYDRRQRKAALGQPVGQSDRRIADDALRNIWLCQSSYPPHDFGQRIDWSARPVPDNEWRWQLHRQYPWNAMAAVYWRTGDEKYARAWVSQLLDWIEHNPHDKAHDYAWRSIEAGIRGHAWMGQFQAFLDSPHFSPPVLVALMHSSHTHAEYLHRVLSGPIKPSNWRLMEAEGLAFVATAFAEFSRSDAWRRKAVAVLNEQIAQQVRPDGMQIEQCANYHRGCIGWFTRTAELARANGQADLFPPGYWKSIERMCDALVAQAAPDGLTPQFGDTSSRLAVGPALAEWAEVFGRDDFRYLASGGKAGGPPKATVLALRDSGFYNLRSDWSEQATCLILKCGPDGGWHCQPDNGTFELFAGGRRLTPDSGTYIYSGDPAGRAWFRRTAVHQTLTLDGADSAYAPRLRLLSPGEQLDVLVVENDSYPKLTHRRAVLFVDKRLFVIVDDAIGPAAGDVEVHFQLAPGQAKLDEKRLTAATGFDKGTNLLVRGLASPGLSMHQEPGQVSFHYGKKQPRPAWCYRIAKRVDQPAVRVVSVLVPFRGPAPTVDVELIGSPEPGADRVELRVGSVRVGYDLSAGRAWRVSQ